ncbi:sensor histidine kinase [Rhodothermaceae bacterium RA]|nr:sensor histidine kinase [Rhodothermaceae bacterium RA]
MRSPHTIGLVLLGLVLLPIGAYVAYEVRSLSANEALMASIYERQLEAILFSINQHAWTVTDGWAHEVDVVLAAAPEAPPAALGRFLDTHAALRALVLTDSLITRLHVVQRPGEAGLPALRDHLTPAAVQRLLQRRRAGYRKVEPLRLPREDGPDGQILLLFVPEPTAPGAHAVGLVLDARRFVQDVLAPKLQDVAREQFVLGIFEPGTEAPLYSTEPLTRSEMQRERSIWLFPSYVLGVRPRGATIEEVVQDRFRQNLLLVVLMGLVLLAGVGIVYRSIRHELTLARMKSDFVSNVSHELRTPLSLIRMYAETLELDRVRSDEKRRAYYRIISREAERLTRLVNNILTFSRIEAGRETYACAPVHLNEVVQDVLTLYDVPLRTRGFRTEVRLADDLPALEGDREALMEAVINLIDNAVKYSDAEPFLGVTTSRHGGEVVLDVADRGAGIPAEALDRIFDKFYRVSTGLVHTTKGTGLGLTLVHHIVEAHGGRIEVESRLGQGTRFRLRFPVPATAGAVLPS